MRHEKRKVFDASDILRAFKKISFYEATKDVTNWDSNKKSLRFIILLKKNFLFLEKNQ